MLDEFTMRIRGKDYMTIGEAAPRLGVSAKTLLAYIRNKIIDEPPKIEYGIRLLYHFPPKHLKMAEKKIAQRRTRVAASRSP